MPHARKLLNESVASTHLIIRMYFQTKSTRNGYIFQIIGVNIFVGTLGPIFYIAFCHAKAPSSLNFSLLHLFFCSNESMLRN